MERHIKTVYHFYVGLFAAGLAAGALLWLLNFSVFLALLVAIAGCAPIFFSKSVDDPKRLVTYRGEVADFGSAPFILPALAGGGSQHLIVADEVQNFTHAADLGVVLSEGRKYGLQVYSATQTVSQLPESTRAATFGNCGTLVSFRVSGEDAEIMEREFGDFRPAAFRDLPNYSCRIRTIVGGVPAGANVSHSLPPQRGTGRGKILEGIALRRWGRPRGRVLAKLARFLS